VLRSGEDWSTRLDEHIRSADAFQLFWSTNSMRSPQVQREWTVALSFGRENFVRPVIGKCHARKRNRISATRTDRLHFTKFVLPRRGLVELRSWLGPRRRRKPPPPRAVRCPGRGDARRELLGDSARRRRSPPADDSLSLESPFLAWPRPSTAGGARSAPAHQRWPPRARARQNTATSNELRGTPQRGRRTTTRAATILKQIKTADRGRPRPTCAAPSVGIGDEMTPNGPSPSRHEAALHRPGHARRAASTTRSHLAFFPCQPTQQTRGYTPPRNRHPGVSRRV
jgi:hypothetical protein